MRFMQKVNKPMFGHQYSPEEDNNPEGGLEEYWNHGGQ